MMRTLASWSRRGLEWLTAEQNLEPKVVWLQQKRLVLDDDDASLSVAVQQMPRIFGCSIETNLEPTIKFYEECVGLDAARTLVANNPRLLGSSLEKRLKPRHAECQDAGIPIAKGVVEPMAVCTEKKWSSSMAFQNTKPLKEQLLNRHQRLLDR
jgi:hypothetical protein